MTRKEFNQKKLDNRLKGKKYDVSTTTSKELNDVEISSSPS